MDSTMAIIAIVAMTSISPGPNNFIIMNTSAKKGFKAALLQISAVLIGSVALSLIAWWGGAKTITSSSELKNIISILGAGYLTWLGSLVMFSATAKNNESRSNSASLVKLPDSFLQVFIFQFLNPKALILIITVSTELSSLYSGYTALIVQLVILFFVSGSCLIIWSTMGYALSKCIKNKLVHFWFHIVMGSILVIPSLFIVGTNLVELRLLR